MKKYDPLGKFLRDQRTSEVPLSFAEIEQILGTKLPPKAQHHRAWWSNNPNTDNGMTKVWLAAGFRSEQVDLDGRRLIFRRVGKSSIGSPTEAGQTKASAPVCRHPLLGASKGLIRIMPGTDLTEPADPSWGND